MSSLVSLWSGFQYQEHQITGVRWMKEREALKPSGGILCDEMGLGKTIQVLGLLTESQQIATLLLAPLSTLQQWKETAERCGFCVWFCHNAKHEWEIPKNYRAGAKHIYLVNYERAISRPSLVNQRIWPRVVFDEAHRMADPKGRCFTLAKEQISATSHWFLTATPIVNSLRDVLSLFKLLGFPDVSASQVSQLEALIKKYVLCRKMEDLRGIVAGLPQAAQTHSHLLDFETSEEEEFYRGIQGMIQRRFRMLKHEEGGQHEMFRLIMRLRQISIHPQVYIGARKREWRSYNRPDWEDPSTKFTKLKALIESQSAESHRWLVFCHFHEEMSLLQEYLLSECPVVRECSLYSGAMTPKERTEAIQTSKEPLVGSQQEVLLVQLQSGGVGLNLQHCDRIIFMGPWWTAALMDQAIGRAVRIGQNEQVEVHHLVLKEEASMNIDKKMLSKAEEKRGLCSAFLNIARGSEAGSDPSEEDDEEELVFNSDDDEELVFEAAPQQNMYVGAGAGAGNGEEEWEELPQIADDENPC